MKFAQNLKAFPITDSAPKQPKKVGEGAIKMSFVQVSNSSPQPSISFSILDLKAQAVRLPVSKGSQILLGELLTWSGEKGYCWWSVPKIAKDLGWSSSAVWRSSTELKESGLLAVIPRPGRSNYWIPLPGRDRVERLQKELAPLAESRGPSYEKKRENLKRCTVPDLGTSTEQSHPSPTNVNAIKICPEEMSPLQGTTSDTPLESVQEPIHVIQTPPKPEPIHHKPAPRVPSPKPATKAPITPEQIFLVEEIERVTGDTWSRGHFVNLVRQTDEQTIYSALSVTREKIALESGVNGGAYFVATLKGMTGLAGLGKKSSSGDSIPLQPSLEDPPPSLSARPISLPQHYDEPEPEPFDPESLKRGWRLHYRGAGIAGMLSLVQRCVPLSVDVSSLWMDVRAALPGMEESFAVDRFLDTVVTRMKHAERMAEG